MWHAGTLRYDTLHLFGTDNMSTADIQDYFETYDPHFSVEWVNDSTCEDGLEVHVQEWYYIVMYSV